MPSFRYISEDAIKPAKSWTQAQLAQFHYFNPNGLFTAKENTDARIRELVTTGQAQAGAYFAYGSLNSYFAEDLITFATKPNERTNTGDLTSILVGLERDIKMARAFIAAREGHLDDMKSIMRDLEE